MPKWLKWVLLVILLLVATSLGLRHASQVSEPKYDGRTLTQWVADYSREPMRNEARAAAVQMVNRDCPVLLKMLAYDPARQRTRGSLSKLLPGWIVDSKVGDFLFRTDEKARRADLALSAFWLAGTNASEAMPDLGRMALSTNGCPQRAVQALACLGEQASGSLAKVITNAASPLARREGIEVYYLVEPRRSEYVRVLSAALLDSEWGVRECATNYLKRLPLGVAKIPD